MRWACGPVNDNDDAGEFDSPGVIFVGVFWQSDERRETSQH